MIGLSDRKNFQIFKTQNSNKIGNLLITVTTGTISRTLNNLQGIGITVNIPNQSGWTFVGNIYGHFRGIMGVVGSLDYDAPQSRSPSVWTYNVSGSTQTLSSTNGEACVYSLWKKA